jgi:hypothetical protein
LFLWLALWLLSSLEELLEELELSGGQTSKNKQ